jgi:hypothetical protein
MSAYKAEEIAMRRRETIALVAVVGVEGVLSAEYRVADAISADERHGLAEKLREIAQRVESS